MNGKEILFDAILEEGARFLDFASGHLGFEAPRGIDGIQCVTRGEAIDRVRALFDGVSGLSTMG